MPDETTPVPDSQSEVTPVPEPTPPPSFNAEEAFARLERNLLTLAGQIQGIQQTQPIPKESGESTDEELWSLAQQGNRQAFELYQERIADRRFTKRFGEAQRGQSVNAQVSALIAKYPEFADPNHPLTQRARAFKAVQIQLGENPNDLNTDLNAMLRAVADSREIIAPKAPVVSRTPAPAHFAPSHAAPQSTPRAEVVSDAEAKLARQMGVKDPAKAKTKFYERQANGASSVSPTVVAALDIAERQGNVR